MYIHTHIYVYIHTYIHPYNTYIYIYIYIHIYIYTFLCGEHLWLGEKQVGYPPGGVNPTQTTIGSPSLCGRSGGGL